MEELKNRENRILEEFFCNQLDLMNQEQLDSLSLDISDVGDTLIELVAKNSVSNILRIVRHSKYERKITTYNIPQFSNYDDVDYVISIFLDSGIKGMTCKKLGCYLMGKQKSEAAQAKYGENHYKLTMQLGFATEDGIKEVNSFGKAYKNIQTEITKNEIKTKMILKIPVIQELLIRAEVGTVNATKYLRNYLSESTIIRRRSNIKKLLGELQNISDSETIRMVNNIIWE